MSQSKFKGVNLRASSFSDINFQGAKFTNVSFANVSIEDANIDGLTIFDWNIAALIKDAQKEKPSIRTLPRALRRASLRCKIPGPVG